MSTGGELNCKWGISSGDSPPQVCISFCSKSPWRSIWCNLEFGYKRIYWRQSQCMKWCGERIGWLEKNWIWIEGLRGSTSASGIQKYSNNSLLWFISFYTFLQNVPRMVWGHFCLSQTFYRLLGSVDFNIGDVTFQNGQFLSFGMVFNFLVKV